MTDFLKLPPDLPLVIGLAGRAGSGKSYLASILAGGGYFRHSFAAPLKAALIAMGMSKKLLNDKTTPSPFFNGKTSRYAMQTLGTEWGRNLIGPDFWVNAWGETLPKATRVVCDDVRFPNEVEAIRQLGGLILWIDRPDNSPLPAVHESETLTPHHCNATFINGTEGPSPFLTFLALL